MLTVVFTGPASDALGPAIVSANLIAACELLGMAVQPAVKSDTTLVVASLTDTVKAKAAAKRGVNVMTNPEFMKAHLATSPAEGP